MALAGGTKRLNTWRSPCTSSISAPRRSRSTPSSRKVSRSIQRSKSCDAASSPVNLLSLWRAPASPWQIHCLNRCLSLLLLDLCLCLCSPHAHRSLFMYLHLPPLFRAFAADQDVDEYMDELARRARRMERTSAEWQSRRRPGATQRLHRTGWHTLSILIETPTKWRGGCSRTTASLRTLAGSSGSCGVPLSARRPRRRAPGTCPGSGSRPPAGRGSSGTA